ncbi:MULTISPECIES: type II toxin-antitoxin system RelE/ParE family toxin [Saccharothrix]|uniref:type II toxin-antitoxin system RelE/ParE family toxin n=1 Tax=Saccharothrix TaxID=2071 RepID=UPI000939AAC6|nr:type II toxin-antitoxin system RelE/ParE family toxin [Saccharothrix sp. CB00851]OKI36144.1 addiction module toxin RelE [Saccharothrix sp. CB00851]
MTDWDVVLHEDVDTWFARLCVEDSKSANLVEEAIDQLAREGPRLSRPLVDRIKGSRHHNMKELRPASSGGSEVRILFAFDPHRQAILLVAGDKSGDWRGWYDRNVPLADRRFDEHLAELDTHIGKD